MKIIHPRRVTLKILLCWPKKIHAKEMLIKKIPALHNYFFWPVPFHLCKLA